MQTKGKESEAKITLRLRRSPPTLPPSLPPSLPPLGVRVRVSKGGKVGGKQRGKEGNYLLLYPPIPFTPSPDSLSLCTFGARV